MAFEIITLLVAGLIFVILVKRLPFTTIGRSGTGLSDVDNRGPLTAPAAKSSAIADSNSVEELLARAEDAFKSREYDTAEAYYLKIAAAKPDLPKVYNRLGIIYLERKNYKDARDAFLTVLRFDNQVAARHYNLAMAYLGLGNRRKAQAALKQALSLDGANPRYSAMLEKLAS